MAVGLGAGAAGITLMGHVTAWLYAVESEQDRLREHAVRPGWPHELAAARLARLVGAEIPPARLGLAGTAVHYLVGMAWGPLYGVLRQRGVEPLPATLLTGLSLFAIVDEGLTPALGVSAPNHAYPLATHLRGLAGHLAFGLGTATASETLAWLIAGASSHRR